MIQVGWQEGEAFLGMESEGFLDVVSLEEVYQELIASQPSAPSKTFSS